MLKVRPVEDKPARRQFVRIPWAIYQNDPHWVAPLLLEREHHISAGNPIFDHLRWCPFIAYWNGEPVGRISAQVDQLHLDRYDDATGFFGMLDAPDDPHIFAALMDAAETWLRGQGMRRVRGPYNLSVNEESGLLVEGFDRSPYVMMGHACPYYAARVEEQDYVGVKDLFAYVIDLNFKVSNVQARIMNRVSKKEGDRVKIRNLRKRDLSKDLEIMRDIFNDAWSENWGFVPFTAKEFKELGTALSFIVPEDMIKVAEIDGEPAAFMVVLSNLNEALHDLNGRLLPLGWLKLLWRMKISFPKTVRVPLMGVRKRYQQTIFGPGLALALITACQSGVLKKGAHTAEMSWILEDNKPMRGIIEGLGGYVSKRYRIYEKNLVAA